MHYALGYPFSAMPSTSWNIIKAEKALKMRHVLEYPYNGEPLPVSHNIWITASDFLTLTTVQDKLVENPITPNQYHYIRNHGGIPSIDAAVYALDIDRLVHQGRRISLQELQDKTLFPQRTVVATMQCSGNRRSERWREIRQKAMS